MKTSVTQNWQIACPHCGADDEIDICACVWVRLCPDGTDPTLAAIGDQEWDDQSEALCNACDHRARIRHFRLDNDSQRQDSHPDPYRQATADAARHAIDRLQVILNDAAGYLIAGSYFAAWGTLVLFDDASEDLKAAIRLHKAANARGQP